VFEINTGGRIDSEKDVFKKRHDCIGLIRSKYMEISTKMKIKLDFFSRNNKLFFSPKYRKHGSP